jgi:hypothetical protein
MPEGAAPTPAPPASSEPSELDRLRSDHARTREELAAANATLRAVEQLRQGSQQTPEQAVPLVRFTPSQAQRVAQQLGGGWTPEHVQAHAPIFAVFLQELAGPLLSGIEGMADVVDLLQTRQEVPKYETFQEEVDRVRNDYRMRGQVITRKQAVAAVQSRRMQDPKYMDELLAEREKDRAAEQQRRAQSAAGAVTEGGATVQKAGPEPTKQPRAPQSKEEFARLPLEEKRKVMEGLTI